MGISLAVGRLTLDQVAEVRILHPQPSLFCLCTLTKPLYSGHWLSRSSLAARLFGGFVAKAGRVPCRLQPKCLGEILQR